MDNFKIKISMKAVIGIGVISLMVWISIFSLINKIPREEMLQIFIASNGVSQNAILEKLNDLSHPFSKVIEIYVSEEDRHFTELFSTQGLLESDILILPESLLLQFDLSNDFHVIDISQLFELGMNANIQLFTLNGDVFGLYITDEVDPSIFALPVYNNNYILCLNKNSTITIERLYETIYLMIKNMS